jgi:hypothetical protein
VGAFQGSVALEGRYAPPFVDVSAEGSLDWVVFDKWGEGAASSVTRKRGAWLIGFPRQVGSGYVSVNPGCMTRLGWGADGTASAGEGNLGLWGNCVGNGYELEVPADRTERVLKLYVNVTNGGWGELAAELDDGSFPKVVDDTWNANRGTSEAPVPDEARIVYTLRYKTARDGAKLKVSWRLKGEATPSTYAAQIRLQAATLATVSSGFQQAPSVQAVPRTYSLGQYEMESRSEMRALKASASSQVELWGTSLTLIAGDHANGGSWRGVMRFSLPELAAGEQIADATVRLYLSKIEGTPWSSLELVAYPSPQEAISAADFDAEPAAVIPDVFAPTSPAGACATVRSDAFAEFLRNQVRQGRRHFGLRAQMKDGVWTNGNGQADYYDFGGFYLADEEKRPLLVITTERKKRHFSLSLR